ncbi:hypothetical protein [Sphingomonas sp. RS2018]
MKKLILTFAALGIAAGAVPSVAVAQPGWQPINARLNNLDRRIDVGIRNGSLDRREAVRLRGEFRQLVNLEARYRRGGLSMGERRDLDRRFDALSSRIRWERQDDRRGRR